MVVHEIVAHATRLFCAATHSSEKVVCKIDFKNAFNCIRRDVVLHLVKQHIPDLYAFTYQCYRVTSHLYLGDSSINSSEGVQQGDPLGPLLFCLGIREICNSLSSELNLWYLDDGTIAGNPSTVLQDFQFIIE